MHLAWNAEQPRGTLNLWISCFGLRAEIMELQTWVIMPMILLLFLEWHINTKGLKLLSNP